MATPTFVAEYATAFNTTTSPKTAMSAVSVGAGDVLVGIVAGENDAAAPLALTENGTGSWTTSQSDATVDFSSFLLASYAASSETLTVTSTSGGYLAGANVVRFSGSDGVGASAKAQSASGSPSVSVTTTQDNSALVVVCTDWNAVAGTQTFTNNFSGTATALTDYPGDGAHYGVAIAYFPDAGTAGSKTVGMSAPTGQKWNIAVIEVKGPSAVQVLRPSSDTSAGTWTASSGSLASCIDETTASDTDYIKTDSNGTCRLETTDGTTPPAGTRNFRFRAGGPANKKLLARILESGTTVQTRTIDPLPGALTDYTEVITGSITNYANVQMEFEIADATTAPTVGPTFGAISAGANGGATVSVPYPTGITAGMLLVLVMTTGATNSETPGTPSGWTSRGSDATTDGTYGVDTGPRRVTVFTKLADGSETGNLSVSITNGDSCRGTITRISHNAAGYDWDIAATSGNDSTSGTGCSVAGGSIGWAPGDLLVISSSQRVDTATQSSVTITASGVTFGTRTNRASTAVTTGNDHRHIVDTVPTTAGTTSAAPTYAYTASAAASVATHFLRIREVPPTEGGRVTWAEFSIPVAAGGDATANGGTVSAAASVVSGAATGSATANGATLTAAASLIAGTASAGTNATANGAVVAAAESVVSGAASGSATAAGATTASTVSLISGSASGDATAAGATVSSSASLIPGTASATGDATANGATVTSIASLISGAATGGATATGATLSAASSLIPGTASAGTNATANGATLSSVASLIVGAATGTATATGATINAASSLLPGSATGAATAAGATVSAAASLLPGSASGAGSATANGATVTAAASLIGGSASGVSNVTAPGATIVAVASLIPGTASASGTGITGSAAIVESPDYVAAVGQTTEDVYWIPVRSWSEPIKPKELERVVAEIKQNAPAPVVKQAIAILDPFRIAKTNHIAWRKAAKNMAAAEKILRLQQQYQEEEDLVIALLLAA